jgi:hypothetical protein
MFLTPSFIVFRLGTPMKQSEIGDNRGDPGVEKQR